MSVVKSVLLLCVAVLASSQEVDNGEGKVAPPELAALCTAATSCEDCHGVYNASAPPFETIACFWHVADSTCRAEACGEDSNECSVFHCPDTPDGNCFYGPSAFYDCEGCMALEEDCQLSLFGCGQYDPATCKDSDADCTSKSKIGDGSVADACEATVAAINEFLNPQPSMTPTFAPTGPQTAAPTSNAVSRSLQLLPIVALVGRFICF